MKLVYLILPGMLILTGCEEPTPKAPPPEIQALMQHCEDGDMSACQAVSNWRSQQQANRVAAYNAFVGGQQPIYIDPQAFQNPAGQIKTTNCQSNYAGGYNCTSY